jgi:starch synthase
MPHRLKILYIASEAAPFSKTGGLADVTGSLPKAMAALGHDVRLVLPAYASIEERARQPGSDISVSDMTLRVPARRDLLPAGLFESWLPATQVPVTFIAERNLFARPDLYGYHDDPYRFAFFSRAALDAEVAAKGWRPDVVHAHDWHTAPAIWWLATAGNADERYRAIPTVFTVHNLMHQGHVGWDVTDYLGIVTHGLREEPYRGVNLMARGIYHATMVTTVSPNYAREIMTRDGGYGLDGLLRHRHVDLHGVLNGLDYDVWNPATDARLAARFDTQTLDDRLANKRALQAQLGLPQRDDVPLVAMVTRLDRQKGLDIVGHVVHTLMSGLAGEAQFALLGSGEDHYEDMLRHLAGYHREKMAVALRYDGELAPLFYAGSDMFLMPSLFEPCGLAQLIAMRYASVPVVRATGGLADTVRDGVTGFTYHQQGADECWSALWRALHVWNTDRQAWRAMQRHAMAYDSSWLTSAHAYQQIYGWAIARVRGE